MESEIFGVRFMKSKSMILRKFDFFSAKAAYVAMASKAAFGSYEFVVSHEGILGRFGRACLGCGKPVPNYKFRCIVCACERDIADKRLSVLRTNPCRH